MQLFYKRLFPPSRLASCRSRPTVSRIICGFCSLLALMSTVMIILMSFTSVRNSILKQFIPHTWLNIPSGRLLHMHMYSVRMNVGECPTTCHRVYTPPRTRREAEYDGAKFYTDKRFEKITYHSHRGQFLPLLTKDEKIDALYTLEVMAYALGQAGLQFFLVDGTLLGLVRNHGMIPWDDDIDVAMNGSQWREIRNTLCCVKGFTLRMKSNMHWRFFMEDAMIIPRTPDIRFPFVDMFLYTEDKEWVWSMTSYNIQNLAFPKSDIFPLASTMFEGREYPIPRLPNKIIRQQFGDLDNCISAGMYHKYNHAIYPNEKGRLSCSQLKDMYDFYDGLDGFS